MSVPCGILKLQREVMNSADPTVHDNYVHVVVMANFMPRMDNIYCQKTGNLIKAKALSDDRLVIIKCKE